MDNHGCDFHSSLPADRLCASSLDWGQAIEKELHQQKNKITNSATPERAANSDEVQNAASEKKIDDGDYNEERKRNSMVS